MEMHMQRRLRHFTGMSLIEVLVVVSILALLVGILLPAIGAARRTARSMQSNTQTRGIHQALTTYAQNNNTWFPGLDGHGNGNPTVEDRFELLLKGRYFTGEYAISPVEQKTAWTTGAVTTDMYSFAMLELNSGASFDVNKPVQDGSPFARRKEWRDTGNAFAPVLTDRNVGEDPIGLARSIHTMTLGDWRGCVTYNDSHTNFETTSVIPKTNYAKVANTSDALFTAASGDDALMIYSGTR
jgi:prepilin-type N-terminal cleavage/methylation domain-containing protein